MARNDPEHLLRAARPEPRPEFVDQLEERILPARRSSRRPRLLAAVCAAAALGAVLAVLAVAGALPTPLQRDKPASAKDSCRTVVIERVERRPRFVVGEDGEVKLSYRRESVRRPVTRCR